MARALILMVAMCACTRARVDEPAKRARHDTLETAEPLALVPGEQHEHLETWRVEVTRPMAMLPAWFVIEVPHPSAAATDVHAQAYTLGPDGDDLSIDALDEHRAPMDLVGRTPARRVFLHVTPRKIRRTVGREFRLEISSGYIAALERLPHANDLPETPCNANQPDFKNLACCSCGNCTASVVRFEHGLVTLGQGAADHIVAGSPGTLFTTTNESAPVIVMHVREHEAEVWLRDKKSIHLEPDGSNVVGGRVVLELPPQCYGRPPQ